MINNETHLAALNNPVRNINAIVAFGTNLANMYSNKGALVSIDVERVGGNKFFGFGICQKANIKLLDPNRTIDIDSLYDSITISFFFGNDIDNAIRPFNSFYPTRIYRDENTNTLSITAYDDLYSMGNITVEEFGLTEPVATYRDYIEMLYGTHYIIPNELTGLFESTLENVNFTPDIKFREILDYIAEATQTIYYFTATDIVFKTFSANDIPVLSIKKDDYFTLDSGDNRRLATITHVTDLGDNVSATTGITGSTQYLYNNPFLELQSDIGTLLNDAISRVGNMTINTFNLEWRGNYLLEIGDCIEIEDKSGKFIKAYVLNDAISYDGTLSHTMQWEFDDSNDDIDDSNSANLGEALKQTFARVDKANKQIDLVTSDTQANSEAIAALQLTTEGITASVSNISTATGEALENISGDIANLTNRVDAVITAEDVQLQISTEIANGIDKVTTSTGFTFNQDGLTVSKSDSEMETTITEDGMTVYRDNEAVLIADHEGVKAEDLHATTYLIIGTNSRFEDYGDNRTGCFWIGG